MPALPVLSNSKTSPTACAPVARSRSILWLQAVTIAWMLVECGVSLYAAAVNRSPALLAFGSDSLVELLSASVVCLQFFQPNRMSQRTAGRLAAVLLAVLAVIVAFTSVASMALRFQSEASYMGVGVTIGALIMMPVLAYLKRKEARRTGNVALAADAVQSATCAWLALVTLTGLAINATFHLPWVDACAALLALPLLAKEAHAAWRGHVCGCC